jgi:hypothetical protein
MEGHRNANPDWQDACALLIQNDATFLPVPQEHFGLSMASATRFSKGSSAMRMPILRTPSVTGKSFPPANGRRSRRENSSWVTR